MLPADLLPSSSAERADHLRSLLHAALEVDHVLSVPQILSMTGVVFDHSGLERFSAPSRAPNQLSIAPEYPGQLWVDEGPLIPPLGRDGMPSSLLAPSDQRFAAVQAGLQVAPLRSQERLWLFELVTQAVWGVPTSFVSVDAVARWPMVMRYREHRVGHLLGAAQVRLDLRVPLDQWHSDAAAVGETERPDAFWRPGGNREIAVEYDTGAYSPETIRRKVKAFDAYDGVVWACSSDRRRRRLRRTLGPLGYQVIQVDWWSPRLRLPPQAPHPVYSHEVVERGRWWTEV